MKKLLLTAAAVALSFGAAQAADLGGPPGSMKDAPGVALQTFSWTGVYAGIHTGLATGNTQDNPDLDLDLERARFSGLGSTNYDISGAFYGAHLGYNLQMGSVVAGIEGSYDLADIQGSQTCLIVLECNRETGWVGSFVGKLGYARGPIMVYGLAGLAAADAETTITLAGVPVGQGDATHIGWTAGLGFALALSNNISVSMEYRHLDLGSETHTLTFADREIGKINDDVDLTMDTLRLGVSFKLGGGDPL